MTTPWRAGACLITVALLTACGGDDEPATNAPASKTDAAQGGAPTSPAPSSKKTYDPATAGSISGVVRFTGDVPEPKFQAMLGEPWCAQQWPDGGFHLDTLLVHEGRVQNAFVWIESGLDGYEFDPPTEPVTLNQHNCLYEPRVLGVQTGQPLWAHSEDHVLHNVHVKPKRNKESNQSLPYPDKKGYREFEFKRPEVMVEVVCDVHAWMKGWIGVVEHPFFAVTGEDGSFTLDGVPPGEYTVGVWHETLGQRESKVTVGAKQGTTVLDVSF
ncbi:MAG: hypothetical protein H6825_12410 [Planctomycetes bacterium]|nr:hypothetical protein [Planctomycetota bacterium]